jgi:hypothetical protein
MGHASLSPLNPSLLWWATGAYFAKQRRVKELLNSFDELKASISLRHFDELKAFNQSQELWRTQGIQSHSETWLHVHHDQSRIPYPCSCPQFIFGFAPLGFNFILVPLPRHRLLLADDNSTTPPLDLIFHRSNLCRQRARPVVHFIL